MKRNKKDVDTESQYAVGTKVMEYVLSNIYSKLGREEAINKMYSDLLGYYPNLFYYHGASKSHEKALLNFCAFKSSIVINYYRLREEDYEKTNAGI